MFTHLTLQHTPSQPLGDAGGRRVSGPDSLQRTVWPLSVLPLLAPNFWTVTDILTKVQEGHEGPGFMPPSKEKFQETH